MARKSITRTYSRYTSKALLLLGQLIKRARIERKLTAKELAERAGISRDMLVRIEKGDPKCGIGVVFELATLVGLQLFDAEDAELARQSKHIDSQLALLPKRVRKPRGEVDDDF